MQQANFSQVQFAAAAATFRAYFNLVGVVLSDQS
jgi:hypothetical protein